MAELERMPTPLSRHAAAQGLVGAYVEVFGRTPTRAEAELLLAQTWGLETGRGESVINFNWGNITGSYQGNFWRPPWFDPGPDASERTLRLHELMLKGQAPRSFRAYPNHEAGARDYIKLLRDKFPSILQAARSGNVRSFAVAVRDSRYCPDCDPNRTTPTFQAFVDEFRRDKVFAHLPTGETGSANAAPVLAFAAIVAAAYYGSKKR